MDYLLVGGPGRSGTSFVADRIGSHPDVGTFKDVELKMFFELDGLFDLEQVLTCHYSPNRGTVALQRFERMLHALRDGGFGQPRLGDEASAADVAGASGRFVQSLTVHGVAVPCTREAFRSRARRFIAELSAIACRDKSARVFLEKTPHNLLNPEFLDGLFPEARYIHVTRDPRAIAVSLLAQTWGPTDLRGACEWVAAYLESWQVAVEYMRDRSLPVLELRIEDVSRDTQAASDHVQRFMNVNVAGNMFEGASEAVLQRWLDRSDEAERIYLDDRLGSLTYSLGYLTG